MSAAERDTGATMTLELDERLDESEAQTLQTAVDEALDDVRAGRVHRHEEALSILDRFGRR